MKHILSIIAAAACLCGCAKNNGDDVQKEIDPTMIVGTWAETFDHVDGLEVDSQLYHIFAEKGSYRIDVYDMGGSLSTYDYSYRTAGDMVTIRTNYGETSYKITKLTDRSMVLKGMEDSDERHFNRVKDYTRHYADNIILDGYRVKFGEYDVASELCYEEMMPENLIEPAAVKMEEERKLNDGAKVVLNWDMTYSIKEEGRTVSSGTYEIGIYEMATCEEACYYYHGPRSFLGYLHMTDTDGTQLRFDMFISAADKEADYGTLWPHQGSSITEGDMWYSCGIRYCLTLCE